MTDLKSKTSIYLKANLFLVVLLTCSVLIILETRSWKIVLLVMLVIWSSARLYYFMFYVIEKYVDSEYRFSGICSFLRYLISQSQNRKA